jgi:hypothetical protein
LCYLISSQIWFINVLDGCQSTYKWQNWKKKTLNHDDLSWILANYR